MNRIQHRVLFFAVIIALLAIPTMLVFAKELGSLTISGPGIKGDLTLNDPKAMMDLEQSGFFDQTSLIKAPENLGQGYTITAVLNMDGKMVPFVQMVYYPADEGQSGYMHITGRLNGETLQATDDWSTLPPKAEKTFRGLMAANNIALQSAVKSAPAEAAPVSAQTAASASLPTPYIAVALAAALLILLGAGFLLRRRAMTHRSA